ncbi:hypothetical protein [Tenacibaculum aiptasiae]
MIKNISNLGTTLNKKEQQSINGGGLGSVCFGMLCYHSTLRRCLPCKK